jgi:hypothetical protein
MAQKFTPSVVEEENDGIHIANIIASVPCGRHTADIGDACWNLVAKDGLNRAICDKRARSAGANGQISQDHKHGNAPTRTYKKEYTR